MNDEILHPESGAALPSDGDGAATLDTSGGPSSFHVDGRDLERLAELTDDLLCVFDRGGRLVRVNVALERTLGRPARDVVGRELLELVHPGDAARTRDALLELEASGRSVHFTHRWQRADGGLLELSWNASPDVESGEVYAIGRDVGHVRELEQQRTRAEARAAGSQVILEAIRHVQRLAIADCEPKPVFDYLLEQFQSLSGCEQAFIGEVTEEDGRAVYRTRVANNANWDEETRLHFEESEKKGVEVGELDSALREVIHGARAVRVAGVAHGSAGPGEPGFFLGIPLREGDEVLGVLGLTRRPDGFDVDLVERLEPLAATTARLLRTYRVRRERMRASEALRLSEQRWRRSIELAAYPVLVWDRERTICYANKSALDLLQYRRHDLVGRTLDEIMWDAELDHGQSLERMHQDGWSHRITHMRSAEGEDLPVELKAVDLGDGTFQAMIFDMREWVAVEQKLKSASQRDNLTGLLNKRAIEEHAEVEIHRARRRAGSVSLLLIDIDKFKEVNDRHGHLNGDVALQRVAEAVSHNVRPTDWVGRWGGEEILVALGDTHEEEALAVAERIRAAVAAKPLLMSQTGRLDVTVSVGVASGSVGYVPSLRQFFERVDRAMYLAKQQGRNRVVCYQDSTMFHRFPAGVAERPA